MPKTGYERLKMHRHKRSRERVQQLLASMDVKVVVTDDGVLQGVNVFMPQETREMLAEYAASTGTTAQALLQEHVEASLAVITKRAGK